MNDSLNSSGINELAEEFDSPLKLLQASFNGVAGLDERLKWVRVFLMDQNLIESAQETVSSQDA